MSRCRSIHRARSIKMRLRTPRWIEVREPGTNRLLFKYDAQRRIIEVQRRQNKTVVDLGKLEIDS